MEKQKIDFERRTLAILDGHPSGLSPDLLKKMLGDQGVDINDAELDRVLQSPSVRRTLKEGGTIYSIAPEKQAEVTACIADIKEEVENALADAGLNFFGIEKSE